jgi:hypothetical protein
MSKQGIGKDDLLMVRTARILLIILLFPVITIVGGNQQLALFENPAPASALEAAPVTPTEMVPGDIRSLSLTGVPSSFQDLLTNCTQYIIYATKDGPFSSKSITHFLFDNNPQPCYLKLAETQEHTITLNRVSHETRLSSASSHRYSQRNRQSELLMPQSCSRYLLESSPPGFFLLI